MASEQAPRALDILPVAIGALVSLLGLASILSFADHLLYLSEGRGHLETGAGSVAYVGGEGLLVVAEALSVLLFTAISLAVLVLRRHPAAVALAIGATAAKVIWLAASVAGNWKPGWYYILDPRGAHTVTIWLFAGSIAQATVMAAAAIALARRPAAAR